MTTPLVTSEWLEAHLDDSNTRIVEVSATEANEVYASGHVPGALGWFWKGLCWHKTYIDIFRLLPLPFNTIDPALITTGLGLL